MAVPFSLASLRVRLMLFILLAVMPMKLCELERRRTQAVLEGQAALLREQARLLNLAYDAIFIRDMNETIIFWNQGAEALYGWPKEKALEMMEE